MIFVVTYYTRAPSKVPSVFTAQVPSVPKTAKASAFPLSGREYRIWECNRLGVFIRCGRAFGRKPS